MSVRRYAVSPRMPSFHAIRRVRHSADAMFDLVADAERYGEFVPLCERNVIRSRRTIGQTEVLITEMTVIYKCFRETFRSHVTLERAKRRIRVVSADGPLRALDVLWTFDPRPQETCDVGISVSFHFISRTLAALVEPVLQASFVRFVEAFERRADAIYGGPPPPARISG